MTTEERFTRKRFERNNFSQLEWLMIEVANSQYVYEAKDFKANISNLVARELITADEAPELIAYTNDVISRMEQHHD
tara:strand:+ start:585 stop:815 length:231 start_codon:yes stop_codon:yes gene_type:complete